MAARSQPPGSVAFAVSFFLLCLRPGCVTMCASRFSRNCGEGNVICSGKESFRLHPVACSALPAFFGSSSSHLYKRELELRTSPWLASLTDGIEPRKFDPAHLELNRTRADSHEFGCGRSAIVNLFDIQTMRSEGEFVRLEFVGLLSRESWPLGYDPLIDRCGP